MADTTSTNNDTLTEVASIVGIAAAAAPAVSALLDTLIKALSGHPVDPAVAANQFAQVELAAHQGLLGLEPAHAARVAAARKEFGLPDLAPAP